MTAGATKLRVRANSAVLLGATSAALAYTSVQLNSLEVGIGAVLCSAAAGSLLIASRRQANRVGLFMSLSFLSFCALSFGLSTLAWRSPSSEVVELARGLEMRSLSLGLAIVTGGLLAWSLGYCFVDLKIIRLAVTSLRRWSTPTVGSGASRDYGVPRVLAVYGAGLGARLLTLAIGRYSYITADLQGAVTQSSPITAALGAVEALTGIGLLLLALITFRSRSVPLRWLLAAVLLIEIPFGLLSGLRSFLLFRLLGLLITYVLVKGRVPRSSLVVMVCALAVLSPFTETYRSEVRSGATTTVDASGAADLLPTILRATVTEISIRDTVTAPWTFTANRLRLIDDVAIVGQRTPSEVPFIHPIDTVLESSTVLVPRAVWHDKPVYAVGLGYARKFWDQPDSVISSRSPTYFGEAFYRGGWIGLGFLMGLLGSFMAALNVALSPRLYPSAIPMFVTVWIQVLNVEGSLVLLSAGLVQSLLVAAVAIRWASRPSRGALGRGSPRPLAAVHFPIPRRA